MSESLPRQPGPDDVVIPFVFVPHGAPEPTEWMAEHPGWVKFPAMLVIRPAGLNAASALVGTAAAGAAESGLGDALSEALGALLARGLSEALAPLAAAEVALYPSAAGPSGTDEIPLETRLRLRREAEGYSAARRDASRPAGPCRATFCADAGGSGASSASPEPARSHAPHAAAAAAKPTDGRDGANHPAPGP